MTSLKRLASRPYHCITEMIDINAVANFEKTVPLNWITPDGTHVTKEFYEYVRPLIQSELTPIYVNGTPRHVRLG